MTVGISVRRLNPDAALALAQTVSPRPHRCLCRPMC